MTAAGTATGRAARGTLYRLLSLGFAPPTAQSLAEVSALAEALAVLPDPPAGLDAVRREAAATRAPDLAGAYERLFGGTVAVSPYEGGYEADPLRQGRQLADVAGFYRAFGAAAHGPLAERPDHAGAELEFLAFLELRALEAEEAGDEAAATLLDGIADAFLQDHAGRWLPAFFAEVAGAESDAAPLHRALAALGARALADELVRRALDPPPLASARRRLAVEADTFACEAGASPAAGR
ncbi:MAG TPA: molecular chaperone TorD family protein [Gaiellaceae bacterium]|nr:molecular chaperone TorD family protein [Gaiellaceae bacterium]